MAPRRRQRFVVFGALALFAVAAACEPIPQQPPPPAKQPAPKKSSPTTTTTTPPPTCQTDSDAQAGVSYFATVDDGDGAPEAVEFEASSQVELDAEVAHIEATEGPVLAVEVDHPVQALVIDDPYVGMQWGIADAGFEAAWANASSQGAPITIAVLDTGSQASHDDLNGGVSQGADFVDGVAPDYQGSSNFGTIDPSAGCNGNSHGTHVAGIAGARDNSLGGIGGAPGVTIVPVRVLNANGQGSYAGVINGIDFAVDQGVHVISMSLGGGAPSSPSLQTAIDAADAAGIVVVAAAGNNGSQSCLYPAAANHVLAVGASNQANELAEFSQYGGCVDVAAPGDDEIYSTIAPNTYGSKNGTSMATPFVSATAALLLACGIEPGQVEFTLESTTKPLGGVRQIQPGSGILDAAAATATC